MPRSSSVRPFTMRMMSSRNYCGDADPRERSRIQESMKALGEKTNNESPAKAQMRELLDRQLALFQELESRRTMLGGQRQHLLEQLRTLAMHLAQLRAARLSSVDNPGATTTIENICRDIKYRVQGAAEVRTLLSS